MNRVLRAVLLAASTLVAMLVAIPNGVQAAPDPPAPAPNFEIVVVPDTQYYALSAHTDKFFAQGQFIADRQPAFALHVGDIVHLPRLEEQWEVADAAWDLVDAANVPYSIAFGNHDGNYAQGDTALYNQYFGTARYENYPWYGGNFDGSNENHYELFTASGDVRFIVISIAWDRSPEADVLEWADNLLKQHPNRVGIILSHELLQQSGAWAPAGRDIYDALKDNPNLRMMFAGHYTGDRLRSETHNGNTVNIMMVDYQHTTGRGNGFLRLLDVNPNSGVINATTYSPYLDEYKTGAREEFSFVVDLGTEPSAEPDQAVTAADVTVSIPVLDNDLPGNNRTLDATTVELQEPTTGAFAPSLTVAGQGTFTATIDGAVLFNPELQFAGNATTVSYRVSDNQGAIASSTIDVEVLPDPPQLTADSGDTTADVTISVDLLANDAPGIGRTLLPGSVTLLNPDGSESATLETNEGQYSVTDGVLTFDPVPSFAGTTNPVTYQVRDDLGQFAAETATFSVTPDPPQAEPDTGTALADQTFSIDVVTNDSPGIGRTLDLTSVQLQDPVTGLFQSVVAIEGVGIFTASPGVVTFDPEVSFHGSTDAVNYRISDDLGQTALAQVSATIIPAAPQASPDFETTSADQTITIDVTANDAPGLGRTLIPQTVSLIHPNSGNSVSSLDVPEEGSYSIAAGAVIFDPYAPFAGTSTGVSYSWEDDLGQTATATLTIEVTPDPPGASPDTAQTTADQTVTVEVLNNDSPGIGRTIDPASVRLQDPEDGAFRNSVSIAGEGTFSASNGAVTFNPETSFTGPTTVMNYRLFDDLGQSAISTLSIEVAPDPPVANPDTATAEPDETISLDLVANDRPGIGRTLDPSASALRDPSDGSYTTDVVIESEGTYSLQAGSLTFDPVAEFAGLGTQLSYRITDDLGQTAESYLQIAVLSPQPIAVPDTTTTAANTTTSVDVLINDLAGPGRSLVASSIRIQDPDDGQFKTSVSIPGEGVYTRGSGTVTFNPTTSFAGEGTSVVYRVSDDLGLTATATFTATVIPDPPTAAPDSGATDAATAVAISVLSNDEAGVGRTLDPDTVQILDPGDGQFKSSLLIPGQGIFDVGPGTITFTPVIDFVGQTTTIVYRVVDDLGQDATSTLDLDISSPPPEGPPELHVFVSSTSAGNTPFNFADEDVVSFGPDGETLELNGSELGINVDIDAYERLADGSALVSLKTGSSVQGNFYDDSDLIQISSTGIASMFFDGSQFGLTTSGEDIDAVAVTTAGDLLISTVGSSTTTAGRADDSDILRFANGQFTHHLRGADFGLSSSSEDIAGISIADDGSMYVATNGSYSLSDGQGSGRRSEVIRFAPTADGFEVAEAVAWSGRDFGWGGETLDGLSVQHLN